MRSRRLTPTELAERSRIPERLRPAHVMYLEAYQERISDVYATTRHKHNSLEHFWCFNNTPVRVIQALLGHASLATVMVYAKLYPATLVEESRKTVRAVYVDHHGTAALHNPTAEEWAEFQASCGMRDMGTHLCALPTGEHCARGLVCLGCRHAQPKQSAAPVFRRMLVSPPPQPDRCA